MPNRASWDTHFSVGNEVLDAQHRNILEHCNALADCLALADPESDIRFRKTFDDLTTLAREHFSVEEMLLTRCGYPSLEEHRDERGEFDYLVAEIITTENFDKDELQTFLVLWWTGHVVSCARKQRSCLEQLQTT